MRTKLVSNMCKCDRFGSKIPRLPIYDPEKGIKTDRKHYLAFSVNKAVYIYGFDVYGTMTRKELEIEYGIMRPDFCDEFNQQIVLQKCKTVKCMDGKRKHIRLKFDSPIKVKKFVRYILYANIDFYLPYRGVDGQTEIISNDIRFKFSNFDDRSLSTVREGNFPTIYFKPAKLDNSFLVELSPIGTIIKK